MQRFTSILVALALVIATSEVAGQRRSETVPERLVVDAERGRDKNPGTERRPLRSLSAAIALLPEVVERSVTIDVRGRHESTGGNDSMPDATLHLMRRTRPGVVISIVGRRDERGEIPVLAWHGGRSLVEATDGTWRLENVQVGSGRLDQRQGIAVAGPAHVTCKDLVFRLRSHSGAAILAHRGGRVWLRGAIRLNEDRHDEAGEETFCGIVATDHGVVKFAERDGASLDIGNGSLSASYYGCIRLGCESARITSWGRQSNNLAVNNGGRIDLHGTTTVLCAKLEENTPIGPEHDGHILGEDAHVTIVGKNRTAIALQKSSTFTCNDITLDGDFHKAIWAMSGSMFVGRFLGDVSRVEARTGASVHIEACSGEIRGPIVATGGAVVSLPDGRVVRGDGKD